MKKILLVLPFLCFVLSGIAQQPNMSPQAAGMFNPLVITNGQANIDGKNSQSCIYSYSGPDSAWTAAFSNTIDKEALVIMYTKTIASNLVVTFPTGSVIKQPTAMPGVSLSGNAFTLSSAINGAFQFVIQASGSNYTVQITRTTAN